MTLMFVYFWSCDPQLMVHVRCTFIWRKRTGLVLHTFFVYAYVNKLCHFIDFNFVSFLFDSHLLSHCAIHLLQSCWWHVSALKFCLNKLSLNVCTFTRVFVTRKAATHNTTWPNPSYFHFLLNSGYLILLSSWIIYLGLPLLLHFELTLFTVFLFLFL